MFKIHQPKGVESGLVLVYERLITDEVKGIDRSVFCEPRHLLKEYELDRIVDKESYTLTKVFHNR